MQNLLYTAYKVIFEWCFYNDFEIDSKNGYLCLSGSEKYRETLIWVFGKHLYYDKLKINIEKTIHQLNLFKNRINYNLNENKMYYNLNQTPLIENDYFCNNCFVKIVIYQPFVGRINVVCNHTITKYLLDEIIYS